MLNVDSIQKAIAAHSGWKARLRTAITTGKFDTSPATVRMDNHCEFGKWLYGPDFAPQEAQTDQYRQVKELHAHFHQQAAKVIEWATAGQVDRARQSIDIGGDYSKASSRLTEAMVRWRQSLE